MCAATSANPKIKQWLASFAMPAYAIDYANFIGRFFHPNIITHPKWRRSRYAEVINQDAKRFIAR